MIRIRKKDDAKYAEEWYTGPLSPRALQLLRECNVFYVGRRRKLSKSAEVLVPKEKAWEHKVPRVPKVLYRRELPGAESKVI